MVGVCKSSQRPKVRQCFGTECSTEIDATNSRAGVHPESQGFRTLVYKLLASPAISVHGFYGHAGNSYGSTSLPEASSFLSVEVQTVNKAAEIALQEISKQKFGTVHRSDPFILSVGSTPTAHAAGAEARQLLSKTLHGNLELHAGKNTRR